MTDYQKAEQFFVETLKCFKLDSFKVVASMDMLLILQPEWHNYLLETKEFGVLKNVDGFDFFVCTTSKSGIAFKGDLRVEETDRINDLNDLYQYFYNLDMNSQGDILNRFFPNDA